MNMTLSVYERARIAGFSDVEICRMYKLTWQQLSVLKQQYAISKRKKSTN